MFWLPLAATVGGAALGAMQGKKRAEREADMQQRTANMRAAEQRYAPLTGRTSFTDVKFASGGEGEHMMSGGLAGLQTGASIGGAAQGMFGSSTPAPSPKPMAGTGAPINWAGLQEEQQRKPLYGSGSSSLA